MRIGISIIICCLLLCGSCKTKDKFILRYPYFSKEKWMAEDAVCTGARDSILISMDLDDIDRLKGIKMRNLVQYMGYGYSIGGKNPKNLRSGYIHYVVWAMPTICPYYEPGFLKNMDPRDYVERTLVIRFKNGRVISIGSFLH